MFFGGHLEYPSVRANKMDQPKTYAKERSERWREVCIFLTYFKDFVLRMAALGGSLLFKRSNTNICFITFLMPWLDATCDLKSNMKNYTTRAGYMGVLRRKTKRMPPA